MDTLKKISSSLEANRIHLLYGDSDYDLFILMLSFLCEDLVEHNQSCLITERSPEDIANSLSFIGANPKDLLMNNKLATLNFQPFVGEKIVSFNTHNRTVYELRSFLEPEFPGRVGIHTTFPFFSTNTPDDLLASLFFFREALGRLNSTVFLTYKLSGMHFDITILNQLKKISSTVINLKKDFDDVNYLSFDKAPNEALTHMKIVYLLRRGTGIIFADTKKAKIETNSFSEGKKILCYTRKYDLHKKISPLLNEISIFHELQVVNEQNEIIQMLLKEPYDLIMLMDNEYNDLQAIIKYLRNQKIFTPIIVMTKNLKRLGDRATLFQFGADELIMGNVRPGDVLVKIENLLAKSYISHTYFNTREYIKLNDIIEREKASSDNFDHRGILTYTAFINISTLILTKSKLQNESHMLLGIKFQLGSTPMLDYSEISRLFRKEDLVTIMPNGTILVLAGYLDVENVPKIQAKLDNRLGSTNTAFLDYAIAPSDGDTIEKLIAQVTEKNA